MKKFTNIGLSFLMLFALSGCMWGKDKEESKKAENEVSDKTKEAEKQVSGSVEDLMNYFKNGGIAYTNNQKLSNFDFAAHEGQSFMYDNQNVYAYRVDNSDPQVVDLMKQAKAKNMITAMQDGNETQYGASVKGDYLLVYDKEAALDELLKLFDKYENKSMENTK